MARIGSANDAPADASVGHHRCAFRDALQRGEVFSNTVCGDFPNEIPDRGLRWHDVGLIATIDNDIMRPLERMQVLTSKVPGDVHEFDRIEGTAPLPGIACAMRRCAVKLVFD